MDRQNRQFFDNGAGFASEKFKTFTEHNGIKHIFTSPYRPSSNGMAECAVQTFKQVISKLQGSIENRITQFLLKYHVILQTKKGLSPVLFVWRRLRTHLDLLHPDSSHRAIVNQERQRESMSVPRKFNLMIGYMLKVIMVLKSG